MSDVPVVTYLGPRAEPEVVREAVPEAVQDVASASPVEVGATITVSGELPRLGPREQLRQAVAESAGELAGAVVDAAIGKGSTAKGRLALAAIDKADPPLNASVKIPRSVADVDRMGLADLRSLVAALDSA